MKRREFLLSSAAGSIALMASRFATGGATSALGVLSDGVIRHAATRKILIAGGNYNTPFIRYMAQLTGKPRPRLCFLPTASADSPGGIIDWFRACAPLEVTPSQSADADSGG